MIWNDHSKDNLEEHAVLSPSGYSWINYDSNFADKLTKRYCAHMRSPAGTAIHDFARNCIELGERPPKQLNNIIKMIKLFMVQNKNNYSKELVNFISSLPKHVFETLVLYIDDCIGFRMDPEKLLVYSESCFGTADAISFDTATSTLRISDLKTGDGPAHMEQLFIYDALFCLEYRFNPKDIRIENRLYQFGQIQEAIDIPAEQIASYMNIITTQSKFMQQLRGKE